jgi:hypothetical protein
MSPERKFYRTMTFNVLESWNDTGHITLRRIG